MQCKTFDGRSVGRPVNTDKLHRRRTVHLQGVTGWCYNDGIAVVVISVFLCVMACRY